ncbi:lysoplasmalogenase [Piscinibacter sp.]|uniref:lysoplasmalogenase n=1 Tax=Piscinibacter sp. TaxID=1903157 RepID=UPI0035AF6B6C
MVLGLLVLASALTAIAAGIGLLPVALLFVAKPLATVLLIVRAAGRGQDEPRARRWILAGLVLSLAGDVALLWPEQGFLPGLIAFLLAHLAYIVAFSLRARFGSRRAPFAAYAIVAGAVLMLLWPGVPAALRVPVLLYVACLATMAAQAAVVWLGSRGGEREGLARIGAIGGALFVLSDALLATNKFAGPLPLASLWVLASYWAAQWCIAGSLRARGSTTSP